MIPSRDTDILSIMNDMTKHAHMAHIDGCANTCRRKHWRLAHFTWLYALAHYTWANICSGTPKNTGCYVANPKNKRAKKAVEYNFTRFAVRLKGETARRVGVCVCF